MSLQAKSLADFSAVQTSVGETALLFVETGGTPAKVTRADLLTGAAAEDISITVSAGQALRVYGETDTDQLLRAFDNGGVILNYQENERIQTTAAGATLTGNVTITGDLAISGTIPAAGWAVVETIFNNGTETSVETSDFEDGYEYKIEFARLGHNSGASRHFQVEFYGETEAAYSSAILLTGSPTDPANVHSLHIGGEAFRAEINHHTISLWGEAETAAATTDFAGTNSNDQRNIFVHYATAQKIQKLRFSVEGGASMDAGAIRVLRRLG